MPIDDDRDNDLGVTAHLADCALGAVPDWAPGCLNDMLGTLLSPDAPFPCTFAVSAARKGSLRFGFVDDLHDEDTWEPLIKVVRAYLDSYQSLSRDTSLLVFWRPQNERLTIEDYHRKFWSVLRYLHERDPERWPSDVPTETDHPLWEFSFGGTPIFVVCNTPAHDARRSRHSPGFVITFQPRWVFEGLDPETPRGQAARRVIRKRLRAFDGAEPSVALGNYGDPENREWRQYFLPDRDGDPDLGCPFHAGRPAAAGLATGQVTGDVAAGGAETRDMAEAADRTGPSGRTATERRRALRRQLIAAAGVAAAAPRTAITRRPAGTDAPLSAAQHRMWLVQRLDPDSAAFNLTAAVRLDGELAVPALDRALAAVVQRHEVLRTTYHDRPDGTVYQRVHPAGGAPTRVVDLVGEYAARGEAAVDAFVVEHGGRPFDLARDLPLRAFLLRLTDTSHLLVLVLHHIACDDGVWALLFGELSAGYRAELTGSSTTAAAGPGSATRAAAGPAVQYGDFAAWQRTVRAPAAADDLTYWRDRLTPPPPPLPLPTDRPRTEHPGDAGFRLHRALDAGLAARVREFGREHGVTPFMTLLAATYLVLHRWTGATDLAVGCPVTRREHPELDGMIGNFGNTVVLRMPVGAVGDETETFADLARRAREVTTEGFGHSELSFDTLVTELEPSRQPGRSVLFDVLFSTRSDLVDGLDLPGVRARERPVHNATCQVDLQVAAVLAGDGLAVELTCRRELFDESTAARLLDELAGVLDTVLSTPERPLADLPTRPAPAPTEDTTRPVDPRFVPELVTQRAAATPDAVALHDGAGTTTYRELDRWANRLGGRLVAAGVRPGDLVGVAASAGAGWVAAMLGAWRAGAAYLPLDPEHPRGRLARLLADVAPTAVLATDAGAAALPDGTAWLPVGAPGPADGDPVAGGDRAEGAALPDPATLPDLLPAYVLHTSGSTGAPKGVLTTRRGVRNYLAWAVSAYPRLGDVALLHSPVSSDMTVLTVFGTLLAGGTLRVASLRDTAGGGEPVADFVKLTPSHLRLAGALPAEFVPRRELVLGGEQLTGELLAGWRTRHPAPPVTNQYGPTETVVACLAHRFEPDGHPGTELPPGPLPIGRPIWNTRAYLLDATLASVPAGAVGELYVAGDGVAQGYLGQSAETAARFLADPFGAPGDRMYRTGDLARRTEDGLVTCLGRADRQLQVSGFRVEPAEIESALLVVPGVRAAAVLERDGALVGYVVGEVEPGAVSAELGTRLPEYLVPSRVLAIPELPLTGSGKLDVAALPAPSLVRDHHLVGNHGDTGGPAEPRDGTEALVSDLAAEVLCLDRVAPGEDLFSLGADSMAVIRLVSRARESGGLVFTPREVFQLRTPARIAAAARTAPGTRAEGGADAAGALGEVPLTPIMRRLLERGGGLARFSQSITLRAPADTDRDTVVGALQALLDTHPMLRADLHAGTDTRTEPVLRVPPPGTVFAEQLLHRVAAEGRDEPGLAELAREQWEAAVARLDPTAGVMLRAAWLDAGDRPGRLVLVAHHLVVDGVSWGVLLDDLATAWSARADGRTPTPTAPGTSFRAWARALRRRAGTAEARVDVTAWQRVVAVDEPPLGARGLRPEVDVRRTGRSLSTEPAGERAGALLAEVPSAYRSDTQDLLLAGLALAVTEWRRRRGRPAGGQVLLELERHGRDGGDLRGDIRGGGDVGDEVLPGADLARTVGWFTAVHPVRLDLAGIDPAAALAGGASGAAAAVSAVRAVRRQLRDTPPGLGWGLLRHLAPETAEALGGGAEPRIAVNYLGRAVAWGRGGLAVVDDGWGAAVDPDASFGHELEINVRVRDGEGGPRLSALWQWPAGVLDEAEVRELAQLWSAALDALVRSAPSEDAARDGSEFGLAGLSQAEIDELEGDTL
jgi:amino acid adenylation domain-containing protein/non-ribosomal peptide synthase protein (TIGR01720 family)